MSVVLVLVGTDHHPFDRLVDWADSLAQRLPSTRVVVQHGATRAPTIAEGHDFVPHHELVELLGSAVAVVCHGGPGTIMDARDAGHVPVVWPRDPEHGEHVDGHQQRFVRLLGGSDLVVATWSTAEVDEAVAEALSGRGPAAGVTDTRATDAARAAVGRELDRIAGRDRSRRVVRTDVRVST